MGWLNVVVGATLIVTASFGLWRLRNDAEAATISQWTFLTLGSSVLLGGVNRLTRPGPLSAAAEAVSLICLAAAAFLLYRQNHRRPVQ